jgi:hypothetical protein
MRTAALTVLLFIIAVSLGLWLWSYFEWGLSDRQADKIGNLTTGVLGGAVVALAVWFLGVAAEKARKFDQEQQKTSDFIMQLSRDQHQTNMDIIRNIGNT